MRAVLRGVPYKQNPHSRALAGKVNFDGFVMRNRYAIGSAAEDTRGAEGVRFELTRPFGLPVFKTGAINHSATPPGIAFDCSGAL